jgi:hypothetical protein
MWMVDHNHYWQNEPISNTRNQWYIVFYDELVGITRNDKPISNTRNQCNTSTLMIWLTYYHDEYIITYDENCL